MITNTITLQCYNGSKTEAVSSMGRHDAQALYILVKLGHFYEGRGGKLTEYINKLSLCLRWDVK